MKWEKRKYLRRRRRRIVPKTRKLVLKVHDEDCEQCACQYPNPNPKSKVRFHIKAREKETLEMRLFWLVREKEKERKTRKKRRWRKVGWLLLPNKQNLSLGRYAACRCSHPPLYPYSHSSVSITPSLILVPNSILL